MWEYIQKYKQRKKLPFASRIEIFTVSNTETVESPDARRAEGKTLILNQVKETWISLTELEQIDIDHYIGKPFPNMKGARSGPVPIVRMFGVTKLGNSVCCHVHGFHPYFYVPAPEKFSKEHIR